MFTNAQTLWVDRFVLKLGSLGMLGQTEQLQTLGLELYPDLNTMSPEDVAALEWVESLLQGD
jgi:hypothetical protein